MEKYVQTLLSKAADGGASPSLSGNGRKRSAPAVPSWLDRQISRGRVERFTESIRLTPELAQDFLDRNPAGEPGQPRRNRRVTEAAVAEYARMITASLFPHTHEGMAFDRSGWLLDGQHRCLAVIRAGIPIDVDVTFGLPHDHFAHINIGRIRSSENFLHISGHVSSGLRGSISSRLLDIERRTVGRCSPTEVYRFSMSLDQDLLSESVRVGQRAAKLIPATTVGLAYYVIRTASSYSQQDIDRFFDMLISAENMSPPLPRLYKYLTTSVAPGGLRIDRSSRTAQFKRAAAIVQCWNAFMEGKSRSSFEWGHTTKMPDVY